MLELVWGSHQPIKAYDILERLSETDRAAKPPTVYRALDFLLEHGLVHRIESLNAFVGCAQPGESHRGFFLICQRCGNADELEDPALAENISHSAGQRGFSARHMTLEVSGTCAVCAGRR